ncbi:EAL domain-containing protein [Microbacterium esteraromaticum]|uniref:EAL domain-containing protein n=1 Tax=Microbacterium esteraromaticum TaxID=57043 RepID=UPI00195BF4AC|nr:EAL domain-containing protein [Microbacterium esteraromaticum]MBM7466331.1 EAL domain-containing protein (putative c-di-GMP-specific phosphodiesterase class I) [Microbacterium esteraromaticum]
MSFTANAQAHFQPIIDVRRMHVVGFEALARFDDGVSPLEHLRVAEEKGRREHLELQLIEAAVDAAASLPAEGFVTLNASGRTMSFPELADVLRRVDRSWGLELFEGAEPGECLAVRDQVDQLGGFLLIDDAGAGFADEKRIRDLRPDIVKIDRALFWRSLTEADGRHQLDRILEAARDVEARTLVEGVEDATQLDAVRELGADLAQGYHLGRPTAVDRVAEMLADLQRRVGVDASGL